MLWITPPGSLAIENWLSQKRESSPSNHRFFEGRAVKVRGWLFWGPQNTLANYAGSKPCIGGWAFSRQPDPKIRLTFSTWILWSGFATTKARPTHRVHETGTVYWLTFLTQMPHQTSVHMPVPWILCVSHRENGGTLGMVLVPSIINSIYTLHSGYLLRISSLKGLLGVAKELGAVHQKGTTIFPMC